MDKEKAVKLMDIIAGEMATTNPENYAEQTMELYLKMDQKEKKAVNDFLLEYTGINLEYVINNDGHIY